MKEIILEILKEYSSDKTSSNLTLNKKKINDLIKLVYPKCNGTNSDDGCYGQMTDDNCKTDYGVIGGKYSEKNLFGSEYSDWSIINRFDTNKKVHLEIIKLYNNKNNNQKGLSFQEWLNFNSKEIFNGYFTEQLVNHNRETLEKGYKNESYAIKIIKNIWEGCNIKQHCSGDLRDRNLGQDLDVEINGEHHYFQVKPLYGEIEKFDSDRGFYYKVPGYHKSDSYKEENVDVIMYVKNEKEYILFNNDYRYILTIAKKQTDYGKPPYSIYYYEEPIDTNMNLLVNSDEKRREIKKGLLSSRDSLIKQYQNRIKQLSQELDKLQKGENPNQTTMFEDISQQLHINKKRLKRLIG